MGARHGAPLGLARRRSDQHKEAQSRKNEASARRHLTSLLPTVKGKPCAVSYGPLLETGLAHKGVAHEDAVDIRHRPDCAFLARMSQSREGNRIAEHTGLLDNGHASPGGTCRCCDAGCGGITEDRRKPAAPKPTAQPASAACKGAARHHPPDNSTARLGPDCGHRGASPTPAEPDSGVA